MSTANTMRQGTSESGEAGKDRHEGRLPRILIIATGGTIASTDEGDGLTPTLSGEDLVAFVPELARIAQIDVVQPMNLDSTNVAPDDWLRMVRIVRESYDAYDGFVLTHGTDTMAYTAAGLAYLIQNSSKPIVLTGSQLSMADPATDAKRNLRDAVRYAADPVAHGVVVVFCGKVIEGTRARKQRTRSFDAFESVNVPPLRVLDDGDGEGEAHADAPAGAGEPAGAPAAESDVPDGAFDASAQRVAEIPDGPTFYDQLNQRVFVLKLVPGLSQHVFAALADDYDALIIEAFGLGGIPDQRPNTLSGVVDVWLDAGKSIVITTQVPEEGSDPTVYEVGRTFAQKDGVLLAGDMTTEAAFAKMMWVRAQTSDPACIRELFYRPVQHDRIVE